MVNGKQPEVCHDRPGTLPGSGQYRPVPYSFYGKCPMDGYFVKGVLRKSDGKYEPCCRKLKMDPKSPDSINRYKKNLLDGYPDGLFGEIITPGDSAVFIPGTKIVESRSHPGIRNIPKRDLISCMEHSGYIKDPTVFEKTYSLFKTEVMKTLPKYNFKPFKSLITLDTLTKAAYMVSPVYNDTIRVKLYFNDEGKSYFINEFGDISESGLPIITELKFTLLEGYLYPFIDPDFIFYPFDINVYKKKDINYPYYFSDKNRFNLLNSVLLIIESNPGTLKITTNFNLNIIEGSKYYLQDPNVASLLFIPLVEKNIYLWTDSLHESITISLNAENVKGNRWRITAEDKTIPTDLLQQGVNNDIELPVSFTKGNGNKFTMLCKINLKTTDFKIENRKPFIPIELLDAPIHTYSDVISILQSINNPISRNTFTNITENPFSFSYHGKRYVLENIEEPLIVQQ